MAVDQSNGNEKFTVKEIVIEIRSDVKSLADKVDRIDREGSIGTRSELTDHEVRLRGLEGFVSRWSGAAALIAAILAMGIGVAAYIHG